LRNNLYRMVLSVTQKSLRIGGRGRDRTGDPLLANQISSFLETYGILLIPSDWIRASCVFTFESSWTMRVLEALGATDSSTSDHRSHGSFGLPGHVAPSTQLSGPHCRLRRSTQHSLEVYSQESGILRSFSVVDSNAARLGPAALANRQTGRCLGGSIVAVADWCFRSCRAARDFVDRRSRPSHPWLR